MADATYTTGVYRKQGGDDLVIASGGSLDIESGGSLEIAGTAITATAAELNAVADMSGQVVNVTDATVSLTAATHGQRLVTLSRAAGVTVTLPAATGTGNVYRILTATTVTSNSNKIQAASASDSFVGIAFGVDTDAEGATGYTWNADSGDDTITMNGSATGGVAGDLWVITDYATGLFHVLGYLTQSGGSEATPFSAAVS